MRLGDGDVAAARSLFHAGRASWPGAISTVPAAGAGWPGRRCCSSLAEDDLAAAEHWSGQIDDPFWGPICEARVHLAAGRQPDAAEAVRRAEPRCARHQVVRGAGAGARRRDVDREAAAKSVEAAVERAAEHGMLQTVAADGGPVLDLVELAAWRAPSAWMDRLRRALVPEPRHRPRPAPGLVEELTSRERDVMRLLPSRLTLREIASELFVSQNTLKFHLRVIYRKLGVNSRAEAVETARRLRLLARDARTLGQGRRKTFSSCRSNSSADSTPRSTRCSSARSWSTRRTASGAGRIHRYGVQHRPAAQQVDVTSAGRRRRAS